MSAHALPRLRVNPSFSIACHRQVVGIMSVLDGAASRGGPDQNEFVTRILLKQYQRLMASVEKSTVRTLIPCRTESSYNLCLAPAEGANSQHRAHQVDASETQGRRALRPHLPGEL